MAAEEGGGGGGLALPQQEAPGRLIEWELQPLLGAFLRQSPCAGRREQFKVPFRIAGKMGLSLAFYATFFQPLRVKDKSEPDRLHLRSK